MNKEEMVHLIKATLDGMVGHKYEYANATHTIKRYRINEEKERVYVMTDVKEYDRPFESVMEWLNLLEPVARNGVSVIPKNQELEVVLPKMQVDHTVIKVLKEELLDNIKKIKADKNYIPQAEAVKANVDSIIDLAKTEVAFMEAFTRMNKKL